MADCLLFAGLFLSFGFVFAERGGGGGGGGGGGRSMRQRN